MARIRQNFFYGTLSGTLATTATTLTCAELADFPAVIAPDEAYLVLDPRGAAPEIVKVTAHTASATTATIVRAQDGTADPGTTYSVGTEVVQSFVASDLTDLSDPLRRTALALPVLTNQWLSSTPSGVAFSATSPTNGLAYFVPIVLPAGTIDRIGVYHNSTGAGDVCRLGVYTDSNWSPSSLVVDAGTIDLSASSGSNKSITISQSIATTAVHWLCVVRQGTGGAQIGGATNNLQHRLFPGQPTLSTDPAWVIRAYSQASVSGALPSSASGSVVAFGTNVPNVFVRYA